MAGQPGKQGRKSQPAALKLLNGRAPGKDSAGRPVKQPPGFKRIAPTKPAHLTPMASQMWDLLVEELMKLDLLKQIDGPMLMIACETYSRWLDAKRMRVEAKNERVTMERYGLLGRNAAGAYVVAPWVLVEERAGREFRAFCSEFGLSPSAEMRLAKEAVSSEPDENDELFG